MTRIEKPYRAEAAIPLKRTADGLAARDGFKRYVVDTDERLPNGNRVQAVRLRLREGDDVVYETPAGKQYVGAG